VTDLHGNGPYIYNVNHLHMHGPSEHRLDGVQYDLEIHIVHELVDGPGDWKKYKETLAVVGVLFKEDTYSHPFIDKLRPMDFGLIEEINFYELFETIAPPQSRVRGIKQKLSDKREKIVKAPEFKVNPFYHYKGSLTNPPCADVVNWIVHKEVLPIKKEHLEAFMSVWYGNLGYGNYRECQHLCGRRVVRNFHLEGEEGFDYSTLDPVTHSDHHYQRPYEVHQHHHDHKHHHHDHGAAESAAAKTLLEDLHRKDRLII